MVGVVAGVTGRGLAVVVTGLGLTVVDVEVDVEVVDEVVVDVVVGGRVSGAGAGGADADASAVDHATVAPAMASTASTAATPYQVVRADPARRIPHISAGRTGTLMSQSRLCDGTNGRQTTTARSHSAWLTRGATSVPRHVKSAPQNAPPTTAARMSTALRSHRCTAA